MTPERDSADEQKISSELRLSVKELYFELGGRAFLAQCGYAAFFEESKTLPHFDQVYRSWRTAIREFNVGTPKKLKAGSTAEQEELEFFFIELRHADLGLVYKKYASLIQNRQRSNDRDFFRELNKTTERRSLPNEAGLSLGYFVLCGWVHGFLWGLSNEHRVDVLHRAYDVAVASPEAIRKTIKRLKLKSWSDFRSAYSKAPFLCKLSRKHEQESCEILSRPTGQG
jgi:hypothetical protein